MPRAVILGTGTDVGKTYLTRRLAEASPNPCLALKPIESGYTDPATSDATLLRSATRLGPTAPLYAYPDPLTPWLASAKAKLPCPDLDTTAAWLNHAEQTVALHYTTLPTFLTLIETAGGVFSPLTQAQTNFDLARCLGPATWLLVATDRLGVLHDISATLLAMHHLGRSPDRVLLCAPPTPDASTGTNYDLLTQLHPSTCFLHIPRDDPTPLRALALELLASP